MAISWLYLLILPAAAQVVHQWTRQRGGEGPDRAYALQVDGAGNAWVAGDTNSSLDGNTNAGYWRKNWDIFLMKFDAQGVHQWTRQRGGAGGGLCADYARALQVDRVGNAWVAGYTGGSLDGNTHAGFNDIFLMKFGAQGVHQWTRQRGGEFFDFAGALQVDGVGNAWVAGYTVSSLDGHTNAGSFDIFLMKFDAQGVHQWTSQHGGEGWDVASALQVDGVGNAWVAGETDGSLDGNTNAGGSDVFLMKFNAQGVHQWTRQRGGEKSDGARALQVDRVGNAWVAGYTYGSLDGNTNAGGRDIFLMKFDAQGVHQWTSQRGGEKSDGARALQADWGAMSFAFESFPWRKSFRSSCEVDVNGHAWVAGETYSSLDGHSNAGDYDIFLMKFDGEGVHQWTYQRGGEGSDQAFALQVDVNGHAWVAGSTTSSLDGHSHAGSDDIFLMKFDGEGVHQWTYQRGGEGSDQASALQVGPIGNVWVAGSTTSSLDGHSNAGKEDIFLMKFQAECSQGTCPAGYMPSPSQSKSTCCVRPRESLLNSDEFGLVAAVVAAVVLPLLTACLCAALGICCYRAKLRRGAEAEPQVPNPLAMLPPLARMTAEWPRGKVQKLSVSETAFELSGMSCGGARSIPILLGNASGGFALQNAKSKITTTWISRTRRVMATDAAMEAGRIRVLTGAVDALNATRCWEGSSHGNLLAVPFDFASSSAVVHQWTHQRGGEGWDYARALQVDTKGNIWVAGDTPSSLDEHTNAGGSDIVLMRFDAQGVHQWAHQRGGDHGDKAYALQASSIAVPFWSLVFTSGPASEVVTDMMRLMPCRWMATATPG
eukprot:s939_g18.t1